MGGPKKGRAGYLQRLCQLPKWAQWRPWCGLGTALGGKAMPGAAKFGRVVKIGLPVPF
jgi:hypothetical protein